MPDCTGVFEVLDNLQGEMVVFEGVDGSGKDTQLELFVQTMKQVLPMKIGVVDTFEPWSVQKNPTGMKIRRIMDHKVDEINPGDNKIDPAELQTLYTSSRSIHWAKEIIPGLLRGALVCCGRERLSTFAYGYAYGIPLEEMVDWHRLFPIPDITLYVRVSLETAMERIRTRGEPLTYFEKKKENLRKVLASYDEIINSGVLPVDVVDGEGSKLDIHKDIIEVVMKKLFDGAFLEKAIEVAQDINVDKV